jgi:hypothetical protein
VLKISEVEVLFSTFTTWGQPVRTQLHQGGVQTQGIELKDELGGYYGVEV